MLSLGYMGTERCPDLKWLLLPDFLPSQKPEPHFGKGLSLPVLKGARSMVWVKTPLPSLGWGQWNHREKKGIPPILSNTPLPCLLQTKTHTQSPIHHPRATHCRPPHLWTPQIFSSQGGASLENSAWPLGEGYIHSKDQGSNSSRLTILGGGLLTLFPLLCGARVSATTPPQGREAVPKPQGQGVGWGKGEEEGAAPPSETQRDVLQPRLHGDAGEGAVRTQYFLPHLQG